MIGAFSVKMLATAVYVPGWMLTSEIESDAEVGMTNLFPKAECAFHAWDGNRLWPTAAANADAEGTKFAEEIAAMDPAARSQLTLLGHSLGGRIVAHTLARLGEKGLKVKQGILMAAAISTTDPDIAKMASGSELPVLVVVNPDDVTLKYVYTVLGGEAAVALGANGAPTNLPHVVEYTVPTNITETTEIGPLWGKSEAMKKIANHYALFYLETVRKIFEGEVRSGERVIVPQGKVNLELPVFDRGLWWEELATAADWKLEKSKVTGLCRILDPELKRTAWGTEAEMRASFEKVKTQVAK